MKGHFNLKSLTFYGGAIALVVILFNAVTTYGTTKLKAPPNINGRYRISAQNLPACFLSKPLVLTIQQSGLYINASLAPVETEVQGATSIPDKPSLSGRFRNQQLSLAGNVPKFTDCHSPVNIEGKFEGKTLAGQISLAAVQEAAEFSSQQEVPVQPPEKH